MPRLRQLALVTVALFFLVGSSAAFELNVVAGLDSEGTFKLDDLDSTFDVDSATGYSLGVEIEFDLPLLELAAGLEYGFPRDAENCDCSGDVDYRMIYGVARFHFLGPLYLAGRVGYTDVSISDIASDNVSGRETWGAGVGFSFLDRLKLELMFNTISADGSGFDLDYEMYSLRLIYSFNL